MNKIAIGDREAPSGNADRCDVDIRHGLASDRPISTVRTSAKNTSTMADRPEGRAAPKSGIGPEATMFLLRNLLNQVIRKGTLTLVGPDGHSFEFGSGEPSITVRITDWSTVRNLFINPELAIGEAYMDGKLEVEGGGIYDLLDLCLANLGSGAGHWVLRAQALGQRLVRRIAQHNPASVSRANVAHHYDLSDTLYELFLDAGRQYSCAYYMSTDDTLERAQEQKQRHIAAKLLLRPGQQVLDIGSGWGGLALHLARTADVDVTGVTLSTEQRKYASQRADEAGLANRVRFLLKDSREEEKRYDRIVSVGMFEHVGVGHYREYFEKVSYLLADDGVALIHTIGSARGPAAANPWINKYIFPGGYTPALSEIVPAIERAGLHITDVEVLRLHYAVTLRDWRERFMANRGQIAAIYDERFCRMWEFYLASCEAAFRHGGLVVFQIQLSKRIDSVPLIRDYITDWEHQHGSTASAVRPTLRGSLPASAGRTERACEPSATLDGIDEVKSVACGCGHARGDHPPTHNGSVGGHGRTGGAEPIHIKHGQDEACCAGAHSSEIDQAAVGHSDAAKQEGLHP